MNVSRMLIALTLALFLSSTTGCKRSKAFILGQRADDAHDITGADTTGQEDQALGKKLNAYIHCLNFVSKKFHDSERRYFSWVDEKKGPTGAEPDIHGLDPLGDTSSCVDGLAKAKASSPPLPALETAGAAYAAALTKAASLVTEAHDYYAQSNYRDDKMAKGKALHPKLVALFDEFDRADSAMSIEVRTLNRKLKERTLANIEMKEGRKISYLHERLMLLAQEVLELGSVSKIEALDVANFATKIDEYESAVSELSAYVSAHKDEAGHFNMIGSVVDRSKNFLAAAKESMRRARDKTPFSSSEMRSLGGPNEWTVDGSRGKLFYMYNQLVTDSNMVSVR